MKLSAGRLQSRYIIMSYKKQRANQITKRPNSKVISKLRKMSDRLKLRRRKFSNRRLSANSEAPLFV